MHLVGRVLCLGAWRSIFGYASQDVGAVNYTTYGGRATGSTRHAAIRVSGLIVECMDWSQGIFVSAIGKASPSPWG